MKRLTLFLMPLFMAMMTAGCSSDEDDNLYVGDSPNTLYIFKAEKYDDSYHVTDNRFYINLMPDTPGFIFHCRINGDELSELVIRIMGQKTTVAEFQLGETFQPSQLNASLIPVLDSWCTTGGPAFENVIKGTVTVVGKSKHDNKDILTLKISDLTFDGFYAVNGTIDFEYEGTVY